MITAIIIDDEADARLSLQMLIERYCPEITIKSICETAEEGIRAIRTFEPQLVFLDIQMPYLSGFEVLQQLWPPAFDVIFVSAYDQYAIKAIRFSAADYLLKPIDVDDLMQAVKRVMEQKLFKKERYQFQSILHNVTNLPDKIKKLAVPSLEGIDFFDIEEIIYCKAEGSYSVLVLKGNRTRVVSKNLKDFEDMLTDSGFCRVHHSYLVNLAHVKKYIKGEGGSVQLTDGHQVDVSRRKKEELLCLLNRF